MLNELIQWKTNRKRKPLILQGARQVGKSWLLKKLGMAAFDNCVVVNIDRDEAVKDIFRRTKDPMRIVKQVSLLKGQPVLPEKTLLVLDEIQDSDEVLNSLKYFYEDAPQYAVACAGSLLGVAMRRKGHSFPVGMVDFLSLYPLSFTEFLDACNPHLADIVRGWDCGDSLPDIIREELNEELYVYMVVGGMPEAVVDWMETRDMRVVNHTLGNILQAYPLDFSKYAMPAEIIRIQQVWDSMKRQLAKDNRKFRYADIKQGARAREYETAIDWLCRAGLTHKVNNTETVRFPLSAYKNESVFKLYINDIGLLCRMFNIDASTIANGGKLMTEFKGVMSENYVLLGLLRQGFSPMYWSSGNQAEIEFVVDYMGRIIPIEVKSKESIQAKSLSLYRKTYMPDLSARLSLRNLQYRDGLLNLPLTMVDRFADFIDCLTHA